MRRFAKLVKSGFTTTEIDYIGKKEEEKIEVWKEQTAPDSGPDSSNDSEEVSEKTPTVTTHFASSAAPPKDEEKETKVFASSTSTTQNDKKRQNRKQTMDHQKKCMSEIPLPNSIKPKNLASTALKRKKAKEETEIDNLRLVFS
ncbi:hypothetical protein [Enterococcus sp. AZ072]|uniref:hypothetical protein n=1 Tax=unclassified Enterococcus TaxID=2608891 RepID=UPI003D27ECDC